MLRGLFLTAVVSALAAPASANDTMAELGTGGLTYVRSDLVQMQSEELFISPDEVRVAYVFKNTGDEDIESVVAFPMPDIEADPYEMAAIPHNGSDNFLDFEVEADGKPIRPLLDQRVFAAEVDLTALLKSAGVPLFPYGDAVEAAVAKLPQKMRDEWVARGLLYPEEFDAGQGWRKVWTPVWRLKSTYWWRMNFPAGKEVRVTHRYRPSVGATVATTFFEDGKAGGENYDLYRTKYCMDAAFVRAVEAAAAKTPEKYPPYYENWISYILRTGGNWATSIGSFRLTIDKGSPRNLVSFCGQGVRKTGPTTFEMTATDFYPEHDLDILILKPLEQFRDDPAAAGDADSTGGGDAKASGGK